MRSTRQRHPRGELGMHYEGSITWPRLSGKDVTHTYLIRARDDVAAYDKLTRWVTPGSRQKPTRNQLQQHRVRGMQMRLKNWDTGEWVHMGELE